MKLNPQDLEKITGLTLDHYNQRAEEFWQGTRDHDVKQNIAALLQWIEGEPPFTILDFGRGAVHTCCELHARHATGSSAFTDNDTRPSLCLYFSMPDGRDYQQPHNHEHGHGSELSEMQIRVRALETILIEKGYVDPAALDLLIETYEKKIGPRNGARVVAKAWVDTRYRQWLFEDATAAVESLGYGGNKSEHLIALENTPAVHNIVVCTLCSCYPWSVLGLPPVWYKSAPYRSRTVADPRGVLRDFGVELPKDVEIRVWDSTSEVRYLVVPMRPAATDGWSEERLADLVTRNSMIGTGLPKQIDEVAR